MPDVYGGQEWYLSRPEPEGEFIGTLRAVPTIAGPMNRPSLAFVLKTKDGEVSVYAAGAIDALQTLVGRPLRVRGKTVDLSGEGGTTELWIARVDLAGPRDC